MTELTTTASNFERVMKWLPESLRSWAESSAFLPLALNEILNDRDTKLSGSPGSGKILTALIGVIQKLTDRRDGSKHCAVILSSSRESEESTLATAARLTEAAGLRAAGTAGIRESAGFAKLFSDPVDLLVTSAKTLEKLFDRGFLTPDAVRTLVVDETEWQEALGDMPRIASLCSRLPAARQIIVTALPGNSSIEGSLSEMLHAPAFCRAPDKTPVSGGVERAVVVPADKTEEFLLAEAAKTPVLFVAGTPAAGTRLIAAMKNAGLEPKRATAAQTESARETLLLRFAAGRVEQLVIPHALLGGFERGSLRRIVHAEIPGSPSAYLEHLALLNPDGGELVTVVTPEALPLFDQLLCSAEKKLPLENPYDLPDMRTETGLVLRREKLTIRADYGKDEPAPESEAAEATPSDSGEQSAPRRRNGQKKFDSRQNRTKKRRSEDRAENADQTEGGTRKNGKPASQKRRFQNKKNRPRRDNPTEQKNTAADGTDAAGDNVGAAKPKFRKKPFKDRRQNQTKNTAGSEKPDQPTAKKRPERKAKKNFDRPRTDLREVWDEDNFGNSIHYQPKRQNLRTLRSDQPIHWEPNDPFHPSSQALSLPQLMPDEFQPRQNRRDVNGNVRRKPSSKGGFRRKRGQGEN